MTKQTEKKDNKKQRKSARKERKRFNRRSMRRRIKKMMALNSIVSIIIMSVLILVVVFGALDSIGMIFSDIVAGDIVQELENPRNKLSTSDMEMKEMDAEAMEKWYHSIGNKFYFNLSDGFTERTEEDFNAMVGIDPDVDEIITNKGEKFLHFSLVFVEITRGDEVVFSTMPDPESIDMDFMKTMKHYSNESVQSYFSTDGNELGTVTVHFNPMILVGVTTALIGLFIFAALISTVVSIFMSVIASGTITKSLADLQRKMKNLSEGELEMALHSELEIKRPFSEIQDLANSTNSIIEQMREYSESLENHKAELEAQNVELVIQGTELTNINNKLEDTNLQMKDILDNVGQGFIRFEEDLMIHSEYSQECTDMFHYCVANRKFSDLIYPNDPQQGEFIDDLIKKILQPESVNLDLYLPLLPEEVEIHNRTIEIDYKISESIKNRKSMIVILTDITEKRELEEKMDEERQILKMVVKAMVNRSLFMEVTEGFEQFMFEGQESGWMFNPNVDENIKYIMRQLHTFKGNFSQFDVIRLTQVLHQTESRLLSVLDGESDSADSMIDYVDPASLQKAYDDDMTLIKEYVGSDFLMEDDMFIIEKNRIVEIEKKMQTILSEQECKILLPEIRSLRYRPIKDLLKMYPEYTLKLAERLNKAVSSFDIQADEVLVDEAKYQELTKAMVHLFRNAVDHGIEMPDDRVEAGKELMGRVSCIISDLGEAFEIVISDDGSGLDVEKIKGKLIEMGIPEESVAEMTDEDIMHQIFEDSLSTQDEATMLSGRGVGLSAVKREVEELGGHISVTSNLGGGTTFTIRIPQNQEAEVGAIVPTNFMKELAYTSIDYINNHVEKQSVPLTENVTKTDRIDLEELTALVSLKGVINALVMISVNRPFGEKLVNSFMYEPVSSDEIDKYIEDVLAEIANTLLGNTLGQFEDAQEFLHMGIPAIISNKGAYVKYTDAEILTFDMEFGDYYWSIHMIQLEGNQIEEATLWQEY